MPNITTCTKCGHLYEESSNEAANEPDCFKVATTTGAVHVQCHDVCGNEVGTYLKDNRGRRVSPLFSNLGALLPWMQAHGWTIQEHTAAGFEPWRAAKVA
jgi:hypothetical protein